MAKQAVKKPISYLYNLYLDKDKQVKMVEVLQVLEDEVLGKIYPWQYTASAETSSRIETLNFLALKQFLKDSEKYDVKFVYRVSARMLDEGNVHKLGEMLRDNLILCFDIYNLEKFGEKDSLMGINYLLKRGAIIMIEGNEKAPIEVIMKYPAKYFLLDNRYYNNENIGILAMLKQIADLQGVEVAVYNVNSATNIALYDKFNIDTLCGSYIAKPRRRLDGLDLEKAINPTSQVISTQEEENSSVSENETLNENNQETIGENSEIIEKEVAQESGAESTTAIDGDSEVQGSVEDVLTENADELAQEDIEYSELHAQAASEVREETEITEEELEQKEELKAIAESAKLEGTDAEVSNEDNK